MRQVQLREEDKQLAALIAEAEAAEGLTILRAGKPVAKIIPFTVPEAGSALDAEREAARTELRRIMDHGYELGGYRIASRDELYDRD
ncbi:type II toxin-antitoxin system prevent-host-death family antitoxin [Granulicella sp. WH15]|uniref:type II toxin-antitoxin system prevent-host-death family antitoxin n=1 Tax=Granulicella sp. WH15 TaxID=2602070 RepID=UPI0013A568E0|nr:type II toxin-antitoxin system prevent-host-death family antitoxin [Granulicella sp. WH15]